MAGGTDVEPESVVVSDNVKMFSGKPFLKQPQNLVRTKFMSESKNATVCYQNKNGKPREAVHIFIDKDTHF